MLKRVSVVLILVIFLSLPTGAYGLSFSDVPENHWAYEYVNEMSRLSVIMALPKVNFYLMM